MTTLDGLWNAPPADMAVSNDEVHVWRASLDLAESEVQRLAQTLSADERTRSERFYFERDRQRFIAGRGMLRQILGRYLGIDPSRLRFRYGAHGKPALAEPAGERGLRFNVSHSQGLALYAVTCNREVGVDLERVRPISNADRIAERFFSSQENAALRALPANLKCEGFFTCWTRKEAYIKARGDGLSFSLDQFDVSLAPGAPAALLDVRGHPQEVSRWSLLELIAGSGYVAALAVEGHHWRLKCWQWPEGGLYRLRN